VTAGSGPANKKVKRCPACKREFPATEIVCSYDNTILMTVTVDQLIGTTLADKYLVMSEVGRGGMSIVYKGKHTLMDRIVAIKMLQSQLVADPTSTKRFQQEAQAVSCLAHPNVIGVFDFGIAPTGQPYLVMDFLVGESLADIIKRDNHVPDKRAIGLFMQACDALEHAHKKGVIHRDLKSSNIMVIDAEGKPDTVKVVDFGIAKLMPSSGKQAQNLTQTGEIFGSPIYMSPEQCLGQPLDARSDIYSMGVLMYEALTGYPPLMGHTIVDTMQLHVGTKPSAFTEMRPDLSFTQELQDVVFKSLQKNPNDRFHSMQEFYQALERVQTAVANGTARRIGGSSSLPVGGGSLPDPLVPAAQAETTNPRYSDPRLSAQGLPSRARITATHRASSASRYGVKSYESEARNPASADPKAGEEEKRNMIPIYIAIGAAVLLLLLVVAFFILRPR
jgi:eukaryotic-like serine/threonine-protein kinase